MFGPIYPDQLANQHPMSCDQDTSFKEDGHLYAVRIQNSWTKDDLISVTGWLKKYSPEDDEKFDRMAMGTAKSLNTAFTEALKYGGAYPPDKYDMIDRRDWEGAVKCIHKKSTIAIEFPDYFLENRRWVRRPYRKDTDTDLDAKLELWWALDHDKRTAEAYQEIFGDYEPRVHPMPPFLTGSDVREMWPRFGTRFHHDAEHFLNGLPPKYVTPFPEWKQFGRFIEYLNSVKQVPFRTELTMSVPALKLCGQADFLAMRPDGKIVLYDWKRTDKVRADGKDPFIKDAPQMLPPWQHRKATNRSKYELQLNIYRQMIMTYGLEVAELYLSIFHKTFHSFQLIPVKIIHTTDDTPDGRALRQMVAERRAQVEEQAEE